MWIKKNSLKLITAVLIVMLVSSAAVFAANQLGATKDKKQDKYEDDSTVTANLASEYKKTKEEIAALKSELGSWDSVSFKLKREKKIKRLTEKEFLALYEKGYGLMDIEKAEEVAALCGKSPEEVLKIKGLSNLVNIKKKDTESKDADKTDVQGTPKTKEEILKRIEIVEDYTHDDTIIIEDKSKSWEEVVKELGLDVSKKADIIGIPVEDIKKMKANGMTDNQVIDAASLADKFSKDYKTVGNDLKKRKNKKALEIEYGKAVKQKKKAEIPQSIEDIKKMEKDSFDTILKEQCNISDSDISLAKSFGINELLDIAHAKDFAFKYKTTLEKVLQVKRNKNDWSEVEKELGGDR